MIESKHTPAPWEWKWEEKDLGWMNPGASPVLRGPDGKAIIEGFSPYEEGGLRSDYPEDVARANASLISAAPYLLAACNAMLEAISGIETSAYNSEIRLMKKAVEQAEA